MKKILNKINKKFLLIFLVFVLLECLFIFPQIFGWVDLPIYIVHNFFSWNWFFPGLFWFLPFVDTSVDDEIWFLVLTVISTIIIPAGFWTTIIYLTTRLIKKIKKIKKPTNPSKPLLTPLNPPTCV